MKVGGQVELQPGWFLGGALGYETDRFTGNDNLTSANGNALLGVVALKHEAGPWTFTGAADASYGWMNSSRVIPAANAVATASPDSYTSDCTCARPTRSHLIASTWSRRSTAI